MEASLLTEIAKFGIGALLAVFFYVRWQRAEDVIEKLRDAQVVTLKEHHATTMQLQREGFDKSLKIEGALMDATQTIAANNATMAGLTVVLAKQGAA